MMVDPGFATVIGCALAVPGGICLALAVTVGRDLDVMRRTPTSRNRDLSHLPPGTQLEVCGLLRCVPPLAGCRLACATLVILVAPGHKAGAGSLDTALADAARRTKLEVLDRDGLTCRRERSVERWLRDLTGRPASAIRWTGGACRLRRAEDPRDSGGQWCGQAAIGLARPNDAKDRPLVEVYFERPRGGHPGKAYAFRGEVRLPGGLEYTRFPTDFEAAWSQRFPGRGAGRRCPAG